MVVHQRADGGGEQKRKRRDRFKTTGQRRNEPKRKAKLRRTVIGCLL